MIRVKISNFIRRHQHKIQDLLTKLVIVAMVVFIATIILSAFRGNSADDEEIVEEVYRPTETIIKGSDVSEEQYSFDSNVVNKFLENCNAGNINEAYSLLSDECKNELYPTLDLFKSNYYSKIFSEKREYNIQSWISTSEYTVYKIRYTNNMMATGQYDKGNVYEDYITLYKGAITEKVSIGNFIISRNCNITTKIDELEVEVVKKKIYVTEEEYEIKVKNNTQSTILMDTLESGNTINLVSSSGAEYGAYTNEIFLTNLTVRPGEIKKITIKFKKNNSSNNKSEKIKFLNIIKDYNTYVQDKTNYSDILTMTVNLED